MLIVDTHILLFLELMPERLSPKAIQACVEAEEENQLACSDITLWEVAMLLGKKRLNVTVPDRVFMEDLFTLRQIRVLPINQEIALLSQFHIDLKNHKDPADRLIVATALYHNVPLMTIDQKLQNIQGLTVIH